MLQNNFVGREIYLRVMGSKELTIVPVNSHIADPGQPP